MAMSRGTWAAVTVGLAGAATAGTVAARRRRRHQPHQHDGWYEVARGVTVDRPGDEVAGFWRDQDRLGAILARPVRLSQLAEDRWRVDPVDDDASTDTDTDTDTDTGTGAGAASWQATVTVLRAGRELRWSVEDGPVRQQGRLLLVDAPLGRGTEIRTELRYRLPGPSGATRLVSLARGEEPDQRLRDALRRAKSLIECGTVVDTRDDPAGRGPVQAWLTDAARTRLMTGGRA